MRKQEGFTLIELVIVIVIIGILAAVALPRFISVTSNAYTAANAGTAGGLGSGVALAHAMWIIGGTGGAGAVSMEGAPTIAVNNSGWPKGTLNTDCANAWNVMQNPPTVSTASGTSIDYVAAVGGSPPVCTFTYQHGSAGTRTITYNPANGNVSYSPSSP